MGIRYYAYPVAADMVPHARADPALFLSHDPLMDAWGPADKRPTMMYLDKCWGYLQELTWPEDAEEPRVSFQLFEGDVHYCDSSRGCWEPWIRLLEPDTVAGIARDLALLDVDDVTAMLRVHRGYRFDHEGAFVLDCLHRAQQFTADMSDRGSGLIYMIG